MILKNAACITLEPTQISKADLRIVSGQISACADTLSPETGEAVIDLSGQIVLPGFVCAHTHLYSALARGMPAPKGPTNNFRQILENIWWKLDAALDAEMIRASVLVGAVEAVKAGVTTLIDHHSSPSFIRGSLALIDEALAEVGLRRALCYEITDRAGAAAAKEMLAEAADFQANGQGELTRSLIGAHAPFTLSDATLTKCGELAAEFNTGIHIHVAEDETDVHDSLDNYGASVATRLMRAGVLTPQTILAHCVHLDDNDREQVLAGGAWVAHNPRSNMNNRVGRAAIEKFGGQAVLGTDGIGADMLQELQAAYYRGHEATGASAETYLKLLHNNQNLVSRLFNLPFGKLEIGSPADLVVLDYDRPTPLTAENLAWHILFGWSSAMVNSVMVNGQWLWRERAFVALDVERIYSTAREQAVRLWQKL